MTSKLPPLRPQVENKGLRKQKEDKFLKVISAGCQTPKVRIMFCSLFKPYYYPNSPLIPRYSIKCMLDGEVHKEYIDYLNNIFEKEKVQSILKPYEGLSDEEDGEKIKYSYLIKFQNREEVPVYKIYEKEGVEYKEQIELKAELADGEVVMVNYDMLRYTCINPLSGNSFALTFRPTSIVYFPDET